MIVGIYKVHVKQISIETIILTFNQRKKLETKNILYDEKSYKNLVIYFYLFFW